MAGHVLRRKLLAAGSLAALSLAARGPLAVPAMAATAEVQRVPLVVSQYPELIGRTPLYALSLRGLPRRGAKIVAKLELLNPMSVKDRPARSMLRALENAGRLSPETEIVEASSGNMAIAVASLCAPLGLRTRFFMPESASSERVAILKAYGAAVTLTPAAGHTRGAREQAMAHCERSVCSIFLNQHDNPANAQAHYDTTARELWEALGGQLQAVVLGLGTGGSFEGTSRFLKEKNPGVRIVGFEPAASPVCSGGKQGAHHITGIGPGFVTANFLRARARLDEIVLVTDQDAFAWTRRLAATEGLLVGITSGAAAKVAFDITGRKELAGGIVACLFYDTCERYLSTSGLFPA